VDYDSTPEPPATGNVILDTDIATIELGDNVYSFDGTNYGIDNVSVGAAGLADGSDLTFHAEADGADGDRWEGDVSAAEVLASVASNTTPDYVKVVVRADNNSDNGDVVPGIKISGTWHDGTADTLTGSIVNHEHVWATNPDTAAAWTRADLATIEGIRYKLAGGLTPSIRVYEMYLNVAVFDFDAAGSIEVQADLGADANTDNQAVVSIDDQIPTGTALTYTMEGSATGAWGGEEVALGAVVDGSRVAGYRYYRVAAALSGDKKETPVLKSIKVEIPDQVFKFSTLSDETLGALPMLMGIPGRNVKLNLKELITESSAVNVRLLRTDVVDQILRENYLRGLSVELQVGMLSDDVLASDLAPYYSGRVKNYSIAADSVTIELSDATKDLNRKVPEGTAPSTAPSVTYDGTHMCDVVLDLLDRVDIASRYIDRGSLDNLKNNVGDGSPVDTAFVVKRTGALAITEPVSGKKLVSELLELLGAYMVIQENGKLQFVEYDSSTAAQETWGSNDLNRGIKYTPALEAMRNQVYVFYDWDGSGNEGSDFASVYIVADAASISNWDTTDTKVIKSRWISGDAADGYFGEELALHIADREVDRLSNGQGVLTCETSLDKYGIQAGDYIDIDTSELDFVHRPGVGIGDTVKFLVTSKNANFDTGTIAWQLTESR
jgi:hypothetical protein